jgi:hypothetical protein
MSAKPMINDFFNGNNSLPLLNLQITIKNKIEVEHFAYFWNEYKLTRIVVILNLNSEKYNRG